MGGGRESSVAVVQYILRGLVPTRRSSAEGKRGRTEPATSILHQ